MPRLNALQFVRQGVSAGLSARASYANMMSEAQRLTNETGDHWTGVARETFFSWYSHTRLLHEQRIEAMQAPKTEPAGGLNIPTRESTVPSGFLNWGISYTRPIGVGNVEMNYHPFRSAQPLTPEEVENLIRQQIEESATQTHGTFTRYTIEGIAYTGVERLIHETGL